MDISIGDLKITHTVLENLKKKYNSEGNNLLKYEIGLLIYIVENELRKNGVEV